MTQKPRIHPSLFPILACVLLLALLCTACKPNGEISGTVTYTDYYDGCVYPAGNTLLYKIEVLSNGTERMVSSVTAGADGSFRFDYVKAGNWKISASLNKEDVIYAASSPTLSIDKGESRRLQLHLDKQRLVYARR